jgi:hypothetical protein
MAGPLLLRRVTYGAAAAPSAAQSLETDVPCANGSLGHGQLPLSPRPKRDSEVGRHDDAGLEARRRADLRDLVVAQELTADDTRRPGVMGRGVVPPPV